MSFRRNSESRENTYEQCKIFVGGLPQETNKDKLKSYFSKWGNIIDAVVMYDSATRRSRGFGFITYDHVESVEMVMSSAPHVLDSKEVECKKACPREQHARFNVSQPAAKTSNDRTRVDKIFVGGLPDLSQSEFKQYFETYGRVTDAVLMFDKNSNRPRGFGFVTFESPDAVEDVMRNYHDHYLKGKWVEVKKAQPRESGPKSDTRSNGRNSPGRVQRSSPSNQHPINNYPTSNAYNNGYPPPNPYNDAYGPSDYEPHHSVPYDYDPYNSVAYGVHSQSQMPSRSSFHNYDAYAYTQQPAPISYGAPPDAYPQQGTPISYGAPPGPGEPMPYGVSPVRSSSPYDSSFLPPPHAQTNLSHQPSGAVSPYGSFHSTGPLPPILDSNSNTGPMNHNLGADINPHMPTSHGYMYAQSSPTASGMPSGNQGDYSSSRYGPSRGPSGSAHTHRQIARAVPY